VKFENLVLKLIDSKDRRSITVLWNSILNENLKKQV